MTRILKLYQYEFLTEFRNTGVFLRIIYGPLLILLGGYALSGLFISAQAISILYWTVLTTSAMLMPLGLFFRETDEETLHFTAQFYSPVEIFSAKSLFSLTIGIISASMCSLLFPVFVYRTSLIQLLAVSISAVMPLTMLFVMPSLFSSIMKGEHSLAALLGLPFVFPVFAAAAGETALVLEGNSFGFRSGIFFVSITVFTAAVSLLLSDMVWRSYEDG